MHGLVNLYISISEEMIHEKMAPWRREGMETWGHEDTIEAQGVLEMV